MRINFIHNPIVHIPLLHGFHSLKYYYYDYNVDYKLQKLGNHDLDIPFLHLLMRLKFSFLSLSISLSFSARDSVYLFTSFLIIVSSLFTSIMLSLSVIFRFGTKFSFTEYVLDPSNIDIGLDAVYGLDT